MLNSSHTFILDYDLQTRPVMTILFFLDKLEGMARYGKVKNRALYAVLPILGFFLCSVVTLVAVISNI